jgi:hypothetical protein
MRLDEAGGPATIAAALAAGVTVFDTARAYGDNERLLARALAGQPAARIVTKGGMRRPEGRWVLDGRARALLADCEAKRRPVPGAAARFIALDLLLDDDDRPLPGAAALLAGPGPAFAFGWRPGRKTLAALTGRIEVRHCPHPGGPPRCWCRPPLPGLLLALAVERGLDPARSTIVGASAAHRQMAEALGAAYEC